MDNKRNEISGGPRFLLFRSLRNKLLVLMILLSLVPLAGTSAISYFIWSKQVAQDRIKWSLEKMAQDTTDKIDLVLREKKEEAYSMAATFSLFYSYPMKAQRDEIIRLLNNYCLNREFYDVLMVLDTQGNIVATNTLNRENSPLQPEQVNTVLGRSISQFPEEKNLFSRSVMGSTAIQDWYSSTLVQGLYDYQTKDLSGRYNIAFSVPIENPSTHEIVGVWINILNWSIFQNMLDNVEADLNKSEMKTGYAFMIAKDADTIIGHKYRAGRAPTPQNSTQQIGYPNLYGMKLIENLNLKNLHDAILRSDRNFAYEFPKGNKKISGLAPIDDRSFGWIVGVGIDDVDIFRPINDMSLWLMGITLAFAALAVLFTYAIAQRITVPLNNLIRSARIIAQGSLSQRVQVHSSDEIGILGSTFNDMARALETRERQLQVLNRNLELMVRQRTFELEKSHDALKQAYVDLQSTQQQLVQTEKMASLGQLVAGIAHEIKNPLNFIYGNTGFLTDYTTKLQSLLEAFESLPSISPEDRAGMEKLKQTSNYEFIKEDLRTLIDNFTEGARRINNIVSDLRSFSRMDTDSITEVDVHALLEISLNLLRNQYKNRVVIHKDYGSVPKIQGYSGKLNQVFMNLLSNAFHAVKDKGDVWIRTRSGNGTVEVEIEDTGIGIPKEHLTRIFEPFFTTKPLGQGTGLGLSISYGIIEQHHGKIHVASVPEKGSTFTVRLPVFQEKGGE